ncbi:MAG TPA: F0F1 ATP synthase subunit alpha [Anaerolineae bacterium]|nr:F0F1 ATP synthase subunit alpha [Anaerolineae bacterium]
MTEHNSPSTEPRRKDGAAGEGTGLVELLGLLRERSRVTARADGSPPLRDVRFFDVGTVQRIGNGVATLSGLPRVRTEELVVFPTQVRGMVLNVDHEHIDVMLLGSDEGIHGGALVTGTGRRLRVPVGRELLGRIVDPLGESLDGRGPISGSEQRHIEREAPGIIERVPVSETLHMGTTTLDALTPIGRGQRELIIGDRQTGKTTLAVDAMLSQKDSGVLCVYVAIGQKKSSTLAVIETLRQHKALPYSIVVVSSPDDPPALRYLAPYAGCAMAEFLMDQGHDVLIVYDDLSKHADAYRELSLLLRRPPGREAYPGDVFYLHARLLERACKLGPEAGDGSLTALPIIETRSGNVAAYIPTNVIAITDGQVVLDTNLLNRGVRPAVNVGLSVSRVGGAAQSKAMRALAGTLRLELAQYEEVSQFARFGAEVDEVTRQQIRRGERLTAALGQPAHAPLSPAAEVIMLLAVTEGFMDDLPIEGVASFGAGLVHYVEKHAPELHFALSRDGDWSDEIRSGLVALFTQYDASTAAPPRPEGAASLEARRAGEASPTGVQA